MNAGEVVMHMASKPKTKDLNLGRASRQYLAQKSETEIARLLRLRGRIVSSRKKSGRRLSASWLWQKWEIDLLGKHPDKETARRIGRSVAGVLERRKGLHIPVFNGLKDWRAWELKLMGKIPDAEVALRTGRTAVAVRSKRKKLRIVQVNSPHKGWREWERQLLGNYSDREVARRTGRTVVCVAGMRHYLRIKGFGATCGRPKWPQKEIDLLGKMSDDDVTRRTGRKRGTVYVMRRKLGIERLGGRLRRWTPAEDQLLRQPKTNEEIARLSVLIRG
jgi:hypothetical protein